MPKFRVFRGRDAYVIEEAFIDAKDAQEAEHNASWKVVANDLDWRANGDVRTFDDTEIMEGEAELWETDPQAIRKKLDEVIASLPKSNLSAKEHQALVDEMRGRTPEGFCDLRVSVPERNAILAGLRLLQQALESEELPDTTIMDILTDETRLDVINASHIDDLCERLNV